MILCLHLSSKYSRGNDCTEPRALDFNPRVNLSTDVLYLFANSLSFPIAIGPYDKFLSPTSFAFEICRNRLLVWGGHKLQEGMKTRKHTPFSTPRSIGASNSWNGSQLAHGLWVGPKSAAIMCPATHVKVTCALSWGYAKS